jgi:benzoylformate decarboxylase
MTDTVRTAFFEQLRRLSLTTTFGNPGSTEETMLAGFPRSARGSGLPLEHGLQIYP